MRQGGPKGLPGMLLVVLALTVAPGPIRSSAAEVHDISTVTPPAPEVKCGCSTCGNPCNVQPPPPPPSPPPPKTPSPPFCPPPPPAPYYMWAPPANLYPVNPAYMTSAARRRSVGGLPAIVVCGFLGLLEFCLL